MNAPVDVLAVLGFHAAEYTRKHGPGNELTDARNAVAELIDDADIMAKWISNSGPGLPDHACVECVAGGELVKAGFRCGYHRALARVGAK